jgi:rhodanese-related sulfurtransferase
MMMRNLWTRARPYSFLSKLTGKVITVDQLRANKAPVVLIDVREPDEHATGIIPSAHTIPRATLESTIGHLTQPQDKAHIVVYCRSGMRSAMAAETLTRMGYTSVENLKGGILAWNDAGNPTVKPSHVA